MSFWSRCSSCNHITNISFTILITLVLAATEWFYIKRHCEGNFSSADPFTGFPKPGATFCSFFNESFFDQCNYGTPPESVVCNYGFKNGSYLARNGSAFTTNTSIICMGPFYGGNDPDCESEAQTACLNYAFAGFTWGNAVNIADSRVITEQTNCRDMAIKASLLTLVFLTTTCLMVLNAVRQSWHAPDNIYMSINDRVKAGYT